MYRNPTQDTQTNGTKVILAKAITFEDVNTKLSLKFSDTQEYVEIEGLVQRHAPSRFKIFPRYFQQYLITLKRIQHNMNAYLCDDSKTDLENAEKVNEGEIIINPTSRYVFETFPTENGMVVNLLFSTSQRTSNVILHLEMFPDFVVIFEELLNRYNIEKKSKIPRKMYVYKEPEKSVEQAKKRIIINVPVKNTENVEGNQTGKFTTLSKYPPVKMISGQRIISADFVKDESICLRITETVKDEYKTFLLLPVELIDQVLLHIEKVVGEYRKIVT